MELKTLKDLMSKYEGAVWFEEVAIHEIRQEAIKRIKYYSDTIKALKISISPTGKVMSSGVKGEDMDSIQTLNFGAIIELIEFFNITEGDLK